VPSAYFDDRKPERAQLTKEFWHKTGQYELYISTLVIQELKQVADSSLRNDLLKLVHKCSVLKIDSKIKSLAQEYVKADICLKNIIMMRYILRPLLPSVFIFWSAGILDIL